MSNIKENLFGKYEKDNFGKYSGIVGTLNTYDS
jgi:hypothetical protein